MSELSRSVLEPTIVIDEPTQGGFSGNGDIPRGPQVAIDGYPDYPPIPESPEVAGIRSAMSYQAFLMKLIKIKADESDKGDLVYLLDYKDQTGNHSAA